MAGDEELKLDRVPPLINKLIPPAPNSWLNAQPEDTHHIVEKKIADYS